jgi:hypothetical protein
MEVLHFGGETMRFSVSSALAFLALTVAACSTTSEQKTTPMTETEDTCGARRVQDRIGEELDVDLFREIEIAVPKHHVRVIKPDTPVTMDYLPDRTNVKIDKDNVITEISCG